MRENGITNEQEIRSELLKRLRGVIIPLVTPFSPESQTSRVDIDDLANLVSFVTPHANCLFSTGNVGEGREMDFENWKLVTQTVINARDYAAKKPTPVLSGILKEDPEEIQRYVSEAERLGVDGIVIAPMYGGKPKEALTAALIASSLPVILYNNPGMCGGQELSPDFVSGGMKENPRIVGIKSSTPNMKAFETMSVLKSDDFKVFQGATIRTPKSLSMGIDGIVPAEANVDPKLFADFYDSFITGDRPGQLRLSKKVDALAAFMKDSRTGLNIGTANYIKYVLYIMGIFKTARMYRL